MIRVEEHLLFINLSFVFLQLKDVIEKVDHYYGISESANCKLQL